MIIGPANYYIVVILLVLLLLNVNISSSIDLCHQDSVYDICLKTCDDGMDGTDVFPENLKLIGDRQVSLCVGFSMSCHGDID